MVFKQTCYLKFKEEMNMFGFGVFLVELVVAACLCIEWMYIKKYFKAYILKAQLWQKHICLRIFFLCFMYL